MNDITPVLLKKTEDINSVGPVPALLRSQLHIPFQKKKSFAAGASNPTSAKGQVHSYASSSSLCNRSGFWLLLRAIRLAISGARTLGLAHSGILIHKCSCSRALARTWIMPIVSTCRSFMRIRCLF
jgi:hypothetical protein